MTQERWATPSKTKSGSWIHSTSNEFESLPDGVWAWEKRRGRKVKILGKNTTDDQTCLSFLNLMKRSFSNSRKYWHSLDGRGKNEASIKGIELGKHKPLSPSI